MKRLTLITKSCHNNYYCSNNSLNDKFNITDGVDNYRIKNYLKIALDGYMNV